MTRRHAENRYIRSYLRIIIRKSINHVFRTRSTCRRKFFITDIYGKESPSIGRNQILDEFMPIRIPIEILSGGNPHMVPNIRISRNRFYPDLPFVQRNQFKFDRKIRTLPDINRFQYLTVRIQELQSRITGSFLQSRNIEYQFVFTNPAPRIDHRNPRFGTFMNEKYRGGASANDRFASRITDKIHDTLDTLLP